MNPFPFTFPAENLSEVNRSKLNWYHKRFVENFYNEYLLGHFLLAAYAAIPAFLTPDLLYKLWQNFNRYKWNGKPVSIHRIAVADLLLSPLCREAGYELYEMDYDIRMAFLEWLKKEGTTELWKKREIREIEEIAKFVEAYHLLSNPAGKRWGTEYIEMQTMEAVSYYKPEAIADKLFKKLRTASAPFRETELLYAMDMFIKTKNRLERIDIDLKLTDNQQKQVDWMHAWKALIEQNNKGFIERLNARPDLFELFNNTQTGVEVTISKGLVTQLHVFSDRKIRALVVGVNERIFSEPTIEDLQSALLFEELLKQEIPLDVLKLSILGGRNASRNAILTNWERLVRNAQPNDDLLLYISSNGVQVDDHCLVSCYDSGPAGEWESWLRDGDIRHIAETANCRSITVFVQADHAATPFWLDLSKPGNIVFTASGFDQAPSFLTVTESDKRYCAFTYSFVKAVRESQLRLSNRHAFLQALIFYNNLSGRLGENVLAKKTPQLLCGVETYNRIFLQGENNVAELQDLLRSNAFLDERTTGVWNKKTARALTEYTDTNKLSRELTKQVYIGELQKNNNQLLQSNIPVFLLIFSDPDNNGYNLEQEKDTIVRILSGSDLRAEWEILIDCDSNALITALKKKEYRNRIQLIYYSGKDADGNLKLKDGTFNFFSLVGLLDFQENIKLFIANTCQSHLFVQYAAQLGVSLSIGVEGIALNEYAAEFGTKIFNLIGEGYDFSDINDLNRLISSYNRPSFTYKLFTAPWFNRDVKLSWERNTEPPALKTAEAPEIYALIVGIDRYLDPSIPLLSQAVSDALRFQEWLIRVENASPENIHLLNTSADFIMEQDHVDRALMRIVDQVVKTKNSKKKLLLAYFAGCAIEHPGGEVLMMLPNWTQSMSNRCINLESYLSVLAHDSYFDGICLFYDFHRVYVRNLLGNPPLFKLPKRKPTREIAIMKIGISSGFKERNPNSDRGLFTNSLIAGLKGEAANYNRNITFRSLHDYLSKIFPSLQSKITNDDSFLIATYKQIASKSSWKFLGKWVWVIGTGFNLSEMEVTTAKAVGKFLAEQGYGLITGGWPGIDYLVSEAYYNTLELLTDVSNEQYLIQIVDAGEQADYKKGLIRSISPAESKDASRNQAFAAISIGGKGSTYQIFQYARDYEFPFIPLFHTGGDSKRIYNELTNNRGSIISRTDLLSLATIEVVDDHTGYLRILQKILADIRLNTNPYKGLHPYTNKDGDRFYGRERLLTGWTENSHRFTGLEEVVKSNPIILITGPAGSGKTSLVNAGLYGVLNSLASQLNANEVIYMRPGWNPQEINSRLNSTRKNILVIDQYEELETTVSSKAKREFENWLHGYAKRNKIIILLRSDFESKFKDSPVIGTKGKGGTMRNPDVARFEIPEFTREEIEEVITKPAREKNLVYRSIKGTPEGDQEFVDFIIDDAWLRPWCIPYLSFILHELVEQKKGNELLESVYREMGCITGVQKRLDPKNSTHFIDVAERLYDTKKITVSEDLQKNRWGGRPIRNGKRLSATVTETDIRKFEVTLIVTSESADPLMGQRMAFFLHDSYKDEIRYRIIEDNSARLVISAHEAFTAAAYLEDGTMLELDLNEQEGYPRFFYYEDVSATFKSMVNRLYAERPITVVDDLQKNRWGGKSEVNNKVLHAEVKKALFRGFYKINILLSSTNNVSLTGDFAFFIHDSFSKEIMFKKALDGRVQISLTAYQAFTVGAIAEDGTTLELDLNQVEGFPDGFYYR